MNMKESEIKTNEAVQAVQELVASVENEKMTCVNEIRMKELGCLLAMYTQEIDILTGEQDDTFLSVLDKVKRLYIPFLSGIIDPVVNYKIKLDEDGYPTRMSKSVALSVLNLLIVPDLMKSDYKLFDMYKQEDYILTFLNSKGSLYESLLDKVKQLYSPLIKDEYIKECKVKNPPLK